MLAGLDERIAIALVGLGLSLVLLALARARRGSDGPLRSIALGAGHRLHVVEVEGRRLLVGTGPGGPPQLLTELSVAGAEATRGG